MRLAAASAREKSIRQGHPVDAASVLGALARPLGASERVPGGPNGGRRRSSAQSRIAKLREPVGPANRFLPRAGSIRRVTADRTLPTPRARH